METEQALREKLDLVVEKQESLRIYRDENASDMKKFKEINNNIKDLF